jgi:pyridoxine 4-dehydrogenase
MTEKTRSHVIGDIAIRSIGVGCANFTGAGVWGEPTDRAECVRLLRRAVELGANLFDTADCYGPFVSEDIVREALYPYPEDIVVGTKIGQLHVKPGDPGEDRWPTIGRPEYLRFALEMSMRRLGVEHVRLVHLHRPDALVPLEDQVGALAELQREGKIGAIGLSNITLDQLEIGRGIAEIVSVENLYNIVEQEETPMLARCEELGIMFLPFFPLYHGRVVTPSGPFDGIANRVGSTPAQLLLAWLLRRSEALVPIPGPTTVAQLEEDLAAESTALTGEIYDEMATVAAAL